MYSFSTFSKTISVKSWFKWYNFMWNFSQVNRTCLIWWSLESLIRMLWTWEDGWAAGEPGAFVLTQRCLIPHHCWVSLRTVACQATTHGTSAIKHVHAWCLTRAPGACLNQTSGPWRLGGAFESHKQAVKRLHRVEDRKNLLSVPKFSPQSQPSTAFRLCL